MVLLIGFCAFIATMLGGLFAIRFRDKLHLILGFSAGAVLGVAFFDLMPEAIELGSKYYNLSTIFAFAVAGYLVFTIVERAVGSHHGDMSLLHSHDHGDHHHETVTSKGELGASSLSLHSFLDGAAIGLAFQVSQAVGAIVAVAVLVHDFSDGINTVSLILKNGGTRNEAFRWLFVDAIAPVIGVVVTSFFSLPESWLAIILAVFSGFFLYISASDLLPESYHGHPTRWTTFMTVLGAAVMFIAIKLAGI
ncbi:MAG: ZIP family metal transporter [Candidatus Paceibacterota bacterium]